ncbi:MAG: choice-of-anchor Q domain-containing protein [Chloroflexota bacterium]
MTGVDVGQVGAASPTPCSVAGDVTPTADLQAAIDAAGSGAVLTVAGTCTGDFVIGKSLTLQRHTGAASAVIEGAGGRPLTITDGTVRIAGLRITGGFAPDCPPWPKHRCGGGVYAAETVRLTLERVTVNGNLAGLADSPTEHSYGGGIYSAGTLTLIDSVVSGNKAVAAGGDSQAGGVASDGALTVRRSRIAGNSATATDGGAQGGGLYQYHAGPVVIEETTVSGNVVRGGALVGGGGMFADGPFRMVIRRSTFSGNAVSITGGSSGSGGALTNNAATTIVDSTFTGNKARFGGAISTDGTLKVRASTIARNRATVRGGGLHAPGGTVAISTTILAADTAISAGQDCWVGDAATVQDKGRNLVGSGDGCTGLLGNANGNKVGTDASRIDPRLGKLLANGGRTRTLALLDRSPAIGAAGTGPCTTATDQRGVRRPQGARCDIGAFERR